MKWFLNLLYTLLTIVGITLAQIIAREIFPYPLNQIGIIYGISAWLILLNGSNQPLWLALCAAIILDFFSSSPFGLNVFALLSSLALFNWLLGHIFTNRSSFIVAISSLISCSVYRIIWILLLTIVNFTGNPALFSIDLFQKWLSEILLSTLLLLFLYLLSTRFIKRLKPHYIDIKRSSTV